MKTELLPVIRFSLIPHGAELSGAHPLNFSENPGEIVGVWDTALRSDILNGQVRKAKKLLGPGNPKLLEIAADGEPVIFFENTGKVIFIDIELL